MYLNLGNLGDYRTALAKVTDMGLGRQTGTSCVCSGTKTPHGRKVRQKALSHVVFCTNNHEETIRKEFLGWSQRINWQA